MAFIRQYAAMSGDPFRFRLPRIIRPPKKLKAALKSVVRTVGKAVPLAASFVPGGGLVGGLLGLAGRGGKSIQQDMEPVTPYVPEPEPPPVFMPSGRHRSNRYVQQMPLETFEPELTEDTEEDEDSMSSDYDQLLAFARAYGWQGDPAPKAKAGKLARAGSPPSVQAAAKKSNRKKKLTGKSDPRGGADKRRGAKKAPDFAGMIEKYGPAAGELLKQIPVFGQSKNIDANAITARLRASGVGGLKPFQMGGHHRRINPANVKALRRGIRRLEGFEKLVKSVRKAAGGLRGVVMQPHGVRHYRAAKGHRAGCRCFACKGKP